MISNQMLTEHDLAELSRAADFARRAWSDAFEAGASTGSIRPGLTPDATLLKIAASVTFASRPRGI